MVDGILKLIPAAKVGHVGLYRDPKTLKPVEYYVKLPSDVEEREFIVVDPMLATGGSAVEALNSLKNAVRKHPLHVSDCCARRCRRNAKTSSRC